MSANDVILKVNAGHACKFVKPNASRRQVRNKYKTKSMHKQRSRKTLKIMLPHDARK